MASESPGQHGERVFIVVSILIVVLLFAVFLVETWWVRTTVAATFACQQRIRSAQVERAFTMRWQLDEETGIRGYVAIRRASFLDPYRTAIRELPAHFVTLEKALRDVNPGLVRYANEEERINRTWLATVAHPLLAHPYVRNSNRLRSAAFEQLTAGKFLIDQFRERDYAIFSALNAAGAQADQETTHVIERIVTYSIGLALLAALALAAFALFQDQLFERLRREHKAYEQEKRVADELAQAFIQKELPTIPGAAFHAIYVPAEEEAQVGGDWYDTFELPDKRVFFSIGDVVGHGLEAAVRMSQARQTLLISGLQETDPAVVLQRTNQLMMMQNINMITAICGYIQPSTREIVYATAGHPPPVMARSRVLVQFLPHSGPPLGTVDDPDFQTYREYAGSGSLFVLYTDGMLEYDHDVTAGEVALLQAVGEVVAEHAQDPAKRLFTRIFGKALPSDDVAILTVSFNGDNLAAF